MRLLLSFSLIAVSLLGCDGEDPPVGDGTESDPVFESSPAGEISDDDVSRWDTAVSWGDHAEEGYLTGESDPVFSASTASEITAADLASWNDAASWGDHALAGYLTSESDPTFTGSAASGISAADIAGWNAASSWGDHAAAGYLTSESDPVFTSSAAAGVTAGDIASWRAASSWGDHGSQGYLTSDCPSGTDRVGAWCIGPTQTAATHSTAMRNCWAQGMRLCPLEAILACDFEAPLGADCSAVTDSGTEEWVWASEVQMEDLSIGGSDGTARAFAQMGDSGVTNEVDWHARANSYVSFCCVSIR